MLVRKGRGGKGRRWTKRRWRRRQRWRRDSAGPVVSIQPVGATTFFCSIGCANHVTVTDSLAYTAVTELRIAVALRGIFRSGQSIPSIETGCLAGLRVDTTGYSNLDAHTTTAHAIANAAKIIPLRGWWCGELVDIEPVWGATLFYCISGACHVTLCIGLLRGIVAEGIAAVALDTVLDSTEGVC
jgi:hypothetical protein